MAPILQSLGQWAVVGLALISKVQSASISRPDANANIDARAAAAKVPLRLMPLGASITDGYRSSDGNGYRNDLRSLLTDDGFTVDMVGSRQSGSMDDNDNEGWSGYRIAQVQDKAEKSVPGTLPNLFTINAGTNDCSQDFHVDEAGQRMADLVEYLWQASPRATVVLSTLIINLNDDTESRVLRVNTMLRDLVSAKQGEGMHIVLAEMHGSDGPQRDDMADDTHPGDVGYNKMANIWFRSIKVAESNGFLQSPQALPSA